MEQNTTSYKVSIFIHDHSKWPPAHEEPLIVVFNLLVVVLPDGPPLHVILHTNTASTLKEEFKRTRTLWCHSTAGSGSLIHRSLCHGCFSRSPTRWGPPRLTLTARAAGHTAGWRAGPLSAESWPDELQEQEHQRSVTFSLYFVGCIIKAVAFLWQIKICGLIWSTVLWLLVAVDKCTNKNL